MTEDRRVTRTQMLLQHALTELIAEKGYDAITIQDITERANVGRSTFYLHYRGKDDLYTSGHVRGMTHFRFGILSKEELLGDEPPANLATIFQYLKDDRNVYEIMKWGKDGDIILRTIRETIAHNLEASLHNAFAESQSSISFILLSNYIAGSQMALMMWWIEQHAAQTADQMARTFHRLQRAAIREALKL